MPATLFMDEAGYAPFGDIADVRCHLRVWHDGRGFAAVVSDVETEDCDTAVAMASLVEFLAETLDRDVQVFELTSDEFEWQLYQLVSRDDGSLAWSPLDVGDLALDLGIAVDEITGEG